MPNSRCIGTGAREGDIALIPGPGRRGTGQEEAKPGLGLGRANGWGRAVRKWSFFHTFLTFNNLNLDKRRL